MAAGVGSLIFTGANIWQAVGGYQQKRKAGMNPVGAALGAYVNYRVWNNPFMFAAAIGSGAFQTAIGMSSKNYRQVRRASTPFTTGMFPDTESIAASRSQLMQSAMASNSSLSLSGRSWSGLESSILAQRYGPQ